MRTIEAAGAAIELEDEGEGDPVLFLHGFPTSRRLWKDVAPAVAAAGFRAIVPDLAGYGASRCPPDAEPDMASQARWMLAVLDALGVERVVVVAHDVGTAVAQILMGTGPERLRGALLMDGVHGAEWAMGAVAPIAGWKEPARLHRVLLRQLRASGAAGRLDEERVREVLAAYEGEEGGARLVRAARALRPEQVLDLLPALRERRVPAHVAWGERDAYLGADEVGRPLAELLGAPLTLLPGGHFLPLELPAEVARLAIGFLTALRYD